MNSFYSKMFLHNETPDASLTDTASNFVVIFDILSFLMGYIPILLFRKMQHS